MCSSSISISNISSTSYCSSSSSKITIIIIEFLFDCTSLTNSTLTSFSCLPLRFCVILFLIFKWLSSNSVLVSIVDAPVSFDLCTPAFHAIRSARHKRTKKILKRKCKMTSDENESERVQKQKNKTKTTKEKKMNKKKK